MTIGIQLAERGLLPEPLIRHGIRRLLRRRIAGESVRHVDREVALARFVREMEGSEVAPVPALPNRQHYGNPDLNPTSTTFGQVRSVSNNVMRFITLYATFRF